MNTKVDTLLAGARRHWWQRPSLWIGLGVLALVAVLSTCLVACRDLATRTIGDDVPSTVVSLTTTILGLAITVPVLCLYYFFRMQINGFQVELMEYSGRFSAVGNRR